MSNERFIASLKPLIWVSKFFGVFPYNFRCVNNKVDVEVSKLGVFFGFFMIFILISSRLIPFQMYIQEMVTYYVFRLANIFFGVFASASLISYFSRYKTAKKIYKELINYSKFVKIKNFYKKMFWVIIGQLFVFKSICLISFIYFFLSAPEEFHGNYRDSWILASTIEIYSANIITVINLQFSNVLFYLKLLFKVANSELRSLKRNNNFVFKNNKSCLVGSNSDVYLLVEYYGKLSDFCEKVNEIFGGSMLIAATSIFFHILSSLYYIFVVREGFMIFVCWLLYQVVVEWMVLFSCESVVHEVSSKMVFKALCRAFFYAIANFVVSVSRF